MAQGFSFGNTPCSQPAASGFSLGAPAVSVVTPVVSTGFSFGAPAASTAASTGFSFGTSATKPAGTAFPLNPAPAASTAAPGFSFGAPVTTAQAATGFSFGTPSATTQVSTVPGFGAPAITTQASTGFSFGAQAVTTQASTGFGFGTPATSLATGFGAPAALLAPSSAVPFVGLGGKPQLGLGGSSAVTGCGISTSTADLGKTDGKPAKEAAVPDVVLQTVETFRHHVKSAKSECELISRHSWAPVQRAGEDTAALRRLLAAVEASVHQHAAAASTLKQDVCEALKSAEVAQRTSEISAGLQYENTAPQLLFERLVRQYEAAMVQYRRQIDQLERLLAGASGCVSPEELVRAIRQLHETFVWLAGHLQTIHEKVRTLKGQYLAYKRSVGGDDSVADAFAASGVGGGGCGAETSPERCSRPQPPGPSPFMVDRNAASAAVAQALGQPALPTAAVPAAASVTATGLFGGGSTSLFGAPSTGGFAPAAAVSPFCAGAAVGGTTVGGLKLDPPPGSKRSKAN